MTREEEIKKQAEKKALEPRRLMHPYAKQYKVMSAYEIGYIEGAVWADAHPNWISVEDELPPRGRTDPNVSVPVITCKIVNRELHEIGFQQYVFGKGKWKYCDATHWMPLPQAPHHIIDANKKVDRVIGTADHIKTALDVLNKKGGEK